MQAVWEDFHEIAVSLKVHKLGLVKPPTWISYCGQHSSGHGMEPPYSCLTAVMVLTTFGLMPLAHLVVVQSIPIAPGMFPTSMVHSLYSEMVKAT